MNFRMETELVEFKKTTGELKEGIVSLASTLNKNGKGTCILELETMVKS